MKGFIPRNTHPVNYILLLLVFILGGFFVGNFFSMAVLFLRYHLGISELAMMVQNPAGYPQGKEAMSIFQGISHFCAFTLGPVIMMLSFGFNLDKYFSPKTAIPFSAVVLAAILCFIIMPVNSWFIDINSKMNLPGFMQGLEQWAKEKEETLRKLTQYLTQFDTVGQFLLGLVVFALIPAIGEELVFRGIIQQQLLRWFKKPHLAIWVTAIIFGAIHLQFYGMLPRTLLGALFGYLYWWSGNIWIPIIGHFINNGFVVVLSYMVRQKMVDYDVDSVEAMSWQSILFSVVLSIVLLILLQKQLKAVPARVPEVKYDDTW
ncbi:CPBP family intramembrane glutamic endopeptidase [Adhaeribacter aquaticus]|uniref:CPBP family intramembrane glutamic endopeptidase n=1 Tax=Adhaeribacter aquaticus TaxID=299567 RepID=UPI000479F762|nr:CPBP family intramembrane glutamic endopeptidase [Adhaeribacter aquaticus]